MSVKINSNSPPASPVSSNQQPVRKLSCGENIQLFILTILASVKCLPKCWETTFTSLSLINREEAWNKLQNGKKLAKDAVQQVRKDIEAGQPVSSDREAIQAMYKILEQMRRDSKMVRIPNIKRIPKTPEFPLSPLAEDALERIKSKKVVVADIDTGDAAVDTSGPNFTQKSHNTLQAHKRVEDRTLISRKRVAPVPPVYDLEDIRSIKLNFKVSPELEDDVWSAAKAKIKKEGDGAFDKAIKEGKSIAHAREARDPAEIVAAIHANAEAKKTIKQLQIDIFADACKQCLDGVFAIIESNPKMSEQELDARLEKTFPQFSSEQRKLLLDELKSRPTDESFFAIGRLWKYLEEVNKNVFLLMRL